MRGKRSRTADHVPPAPTRAWRRLPVLRTVVTGLPRTAVVLLRMPDVAGTRSVLPELRLRGRRKLPATAGSRTNEMSTVDDFVPDTPVVVGRTTGLLVVRPEPPAPLPEHDPAPLVDQDGSDDPVLPVVPSVRRPAVPRRPATPALTTASAEFVSEPVEPDSPFRSMTELDRLAAQYEAMGIETALGMLGLGEASGLAAFAAPPPPPEPTPAVRPPRGPRARPTLGQSRRRGVGLPIPPATRDDSGEPPVPDAQPVLPVPDAPAERSTPPVIPPATTHADVDTTVEPHSIPPTSQPSPLPAVPAHPLVHNDEQDGDGRPDERRTGRTVVQPPLFTSPPKTRPTTTSGDAPPPRLPAPPPARTTPPQDSGIQPHQPQQPSAAHEPLPHRRAAEAPTVRWDGPVHRAPIGQGPTSSTFKSDVDDHPEPLAPEVVTAIAREPGTDVADVPVLGKQVVLQRTVSFAEPESVEVRVPSDVVAAFRRDLGVDVADVPVHSGRAVTRQAAGLRARAFTQGGRVHLPHAVATMDRGDTRALLAHELVHVVQQRVLDTDMPDEDSAHGQELEAVARSAERWFLGEEQAPVSLVHRTRPATTTAQTTQPITTHALQRAPQPTTTDSPTPVHENTDAVPVGSTMSWTPETGFTEAHRPDAAAPPSSPAHHQDTGSDSAGLAEAFTQIADLRSTLAALRRDREASRDDPPDDLTPQPGRLDADSLADRLYGHIRSRLRSELLVDRERTGSLADPGPGGHR
ncbi:DUF4157 domain-containing protein [Umezawaea tangerina]|uniref:eCIS core domain-containing protein n=1 Tax=Umezawaea tangerina TaxID=84725 RepID=UPI0011B2948C|nr:DUF4157 domain-containing protein [Umezawaea tangerina]